MVSHLRIHVILRAYCVGLSTSSERVRHDNMVMIEEQISGLDGFQQEACEAHDCICITMVFNLLPR